MAVAAALSDLCQALSGHLVSPGRLERRQSFLPTGLAALDDVLGGGWPLGTLSELAGDGLPRATVARRSSGRTSVLYASVAAAQRRGEAVALVDVGGSLDAPAAQRAGIELSRLLWVRANDRQHLSAADLLVTAGGFGLVAVDLADCPLRVPAATWLRLARGAERQSTVVLLSAPWRLAGSFAAAAVVVSGRDVCFEGSGDGPRLFLGFDASAVVARSRGHVDASLAAAPRLSLSL